MGLLIILLVGVLVGWLASVVTGMGGGLIFDMVVGIVGALVAGWILAAALRFSAARSRSCRSYIQCSARSSYFWSSASCVVAVGDDDAQLRSLPVDQERNPAGWNSSICSVGSVLNLVAAI